MCRRVRRKRYQHGRTHSQSEVRSTVPLAQVRSHAAQHPEGVTLLMDRTGVLIRLVPEESITATPELSNVTAGSLEDALVGYGGSVEPRVRTENTREGDLCHPQSEHEPTEDLGLAVAYRVSSNHLETACGKVQKRAFGILE